MTFLNWEEFVHCPDFIFTIATFGAKEQRKEIEDNLGEVVKEIEDLVDNGITIGYCK
jgi:hypothetical protein